MMRATIGEAGQAIDAVAKLVERSLRGLQEHCREGDRLSTKRMDEHQVPLYQLTGLATRLAASRHLLDHARRQDGVSSPSSRLVVALAALHAAEVAGTARQQLALPDADFALPAGAIAEAMAEPSLTDFLRAAWAGEAYQTAAELIVETNSAGSDGLDDEHEALVHLFRRYAAEKVAPLAEQIHREDQLLPDEQIEELAQMGVFGLSIPARYGGFQDEENPDHLAMVIVSDELSRASFGTAGSLGTRPELLARALLKGGTEAQKEKWLPLIASGARQTAVAITEPDYGSDVAHLAMSARRVEGGWRLNGRKMWSTFAGRATILMVLARTDPDAARAHRGLTMFIVEKPPFYGHSFDHRQDGGRLSGSAIPTIGYRGMHSFDLSFEDTFVPDANVIGGAEGLGQGFYLQMHGFGGSRLQTAARALGLMAAAFHEALGYARERRVFGRRLLDYPLTRHRLARMAAHIQAARRLTYRAAAELDAGAGAVAAAMAKLLAGRTAEWITRDAQQLHGGMGYAEEFPISRHFLDARVLAIFEGAEEVLALRVIARHLLENPAHTSVAQ